MYKFNNIPSLDELDDFINSKLEEETIVVDDDRFKCKNESCGTICKPGDKYCHSCGMEREKASDEINAKVTSVMSMSIRINSGSGKRVNINASRDYSTTQYEEINKELTKLNEKFVQNGGVKVPDVVIRNVTERYTEFVRKTKTIKKGANKKAILGYLLLDECENHKTPRTPSSISKFLGIRSQSLSRGRDDYINIVTSDTKEVYVSNQSNARDYAVRYLTALNLEKEDLNKYADFVQEIFEFSEEKKIEILILPTSKIAGCIWFIVNKLKLEKKFNATKISEICDNIQRATFTKFYNVILKFEKTHFAEIIEKYFD